MGGVGISNVCTMYPEGMTSSLIYSWSESEASYSGDWNTCSSIRKRIKVFDKYSEANKKKFWTMAKYEKLRDQNVEKWGSTVFDLGVEYYEVWSFKKEPVKKEKPVYEWKYTVNDRAFNDKASAEKHAQQMVLKGQGIASVKKERIKVKGTEIESAFRLVKKTYKSKPKSVKAGSVLREFHRYYVEAIASC